MQPALWNLGNGWETLRARNGGRLPDYLPYTVTVELLVPPSPDAFTPTALLTGRAPLDEDAEFWVLSSCMAGQTADQSPTNEWLGALEDCSGDLWYGALVRVQEEEAGRVLSNVPVYAASIFGAKGQVQDGAAPRRVRDPYFYPAPWILPPGGTLRVDLETRWAGQNFGDADATTRVWFSFFGFKRYLNQPTPDVDWLLEPRLLGILETYRRAGYRPRIEPYFYGLNFAPTFDEPDAALRRSAMNTEQVTVSISDADFAGIHLMGQVNDPNNIWQGGQDSFLGFLNVSGGPPATTPASRDTVRLVVDQGASRLDDRALGFRTIMGNGRRPMRWPVPLHLQMGQSLSAVMQFGETNGIDPEPFRAYITVGGVRIWA